MIVDTGEKNNPKQQQKQNHTTTKGNKKQTNKNDYKQRFPAAAMKEKN